MAIFLDIYDLFQLLPTQKLNNSVVSPNTIGMNMNISEKKFRIIECGLSLSDLREIRKDIIWAENKTIFQRLFYNWDSKKCFRHTGK